MNRYEVVIEKDGELTCEILYAKNKHDAESTFDRRYEEKGKYVRIVECHLI